LCSAMVLDFLNWVFKSANGTDGRDRRAPCLNAYNFLSVVSCY
jgi:hypothetical protein